MKIIYSTFLFVFFIAFSTSCKKSVVGCSGIAYANELSAELNALSTASAAYGQDPSTANCNAYKNAFQNYLNGLNKYKNCTFTTGERAQFNAALQDAQDNLDMLVC